MTTTTPLDEAYALRAEIDAVIDDIRKAEGRLLTLTEQWAEARGRLSPHTATPHDILERVASELHVTVRALKSRERTRDLVRARQIAMYVLREHDLSLPHIGKLLDRDHTTVVWGIRRVRSDLEQLEDAVAILALTIPRPRTLKAV